MLPVRKDHLISPKNQHSQQPNRGFSKEDRNDEEEKPETGMLSTAGFHEVQENKGAKSMPTNEAYKWTDEDAVMRTAPSKRESRKSKQIHALEEQESYPVA